MKFSENGKLKYNSIKKLYSIYDFSFLNWRQVLKSEAI